MNGTNSDLKKRQDNNDSLKLGRFSIANQLRYGLVLFILVTLLVTASVLIILSFLTQQTQLETVQRELGRAAAGEINTYLDDLQRKLAYLARVRGLADLSTDIQHNLLEGLVRHNDAYELVAILDGTGQVITISSPYGQTLPGSLADTPLFSRAFKQKEDYVGPVELNSETGLPVVTLAVPIRDQEDEVNGVLLAQVNLEYLWFVVSQTNVGETGYVYVLDNRNFLIAQKGSAAETFQLEDISDRPFIQQLTSGATNALTWYEGLQGRYVLGAIAPIRSVRWNVVVELPVIEAYGPLINMVLIMLAVLIVVTAMAVGLSITFTRQIVQPLQHLTEASSQISAGQMDAQVNISSRNEMGILATTFNQMTAQLSELYSTLEQQVAARTHRLEVLGGLGERLSAILRLEELLVEVVEQIKENFGYYHAHIYLIDEKRERLVVAAGVGLAGEEMKAKRHSIRLDVPTSLVARAARTHEIVRVDDVRQAPDWLPNPLLPDTRAEMAVPIVLDGQVVGVLDVQQDKVGGLDESDASLLRSLANQVAIAMRNANLFAEVETALAQARAAQERYIEQVWHKARSASRQGRHHFTLPEATPLDESSLVEARQQALVQQQPVVVPVANGAQQKEVDEGQRTGALVAPVKLRESIIGSLQLHPLQEGRSWTEDDLAIVEAVVDELAQTAENLRLFEETRQRAGREQAIREITDKLRAAPNLDYLLETASRELAQRLGVRHTVVELGIETEIQSSPASTTKNGH